MKKILIVDDSENNRSLIKAALDYYTIEEAENAEDGLRIIKKSSPDLILIDQVMPGMDGLEMLGKIYGINPSAKCIMITAYESVQLAKSAFKSGVVDFIVKPFEIDHLRTAVTEILE